MVIERILVEGDDGAIGSMQHAVHDRAIDFLVKLHIGKRCCPLLQGVPRGAGADHHEMDPGIRFAKDRSRVENGLHRIRRAHAAGVQDDAPACCFSALMRSTRG